MILSNYRKRLEADLTKWTGAGLIAAEQAGAIRRAVLADGSGVKLPAILGMLGGLLLASGVAAFVAANWEYVPRIGKLAGILIAIIIAALAALRYDKRGAALASDAASTCATLIFGAGVALVGQMYHLPADWQAGTLLVGIGAFTVAALMRSDGALAIAFICAVAWLFGAFEERGLGTNWWYLALYLPCLVLAFGRNSRMVHHVAVLGAIAWLVMVAGTTGDLFRENEIGTHIAYLLFVATAFIALGNLADEGRLPQLFSACTAWGLLGFVMVIALQLARILEPSMAMAGYAAQRVVISGIVAVCAVAAMFVSSSEKKGALALTIALVAAMATSLVFWSEIGPLTMGRIVISALVLASACAMVVAGSVLGQRRMSLAGAAAFGISVIVLLYKTVGTLLDQSLFFLIGGVLLIAIGGGVRKLLQRFNPSEGAPS